MLETTSRLTDAITAELALLEEHERNAVMLWLAGRGLLGIAHQRGFEAASAAAYVMADKLAEGVQ